MILITTVAFIINKVKIIIVNRAVVLEGMEGIIIVIIMIEMIANHLR